MSLNNRPQRNFFNDNSFWFLLLSNLITIFIATKENWDLSTIMWIYWFQSIIIGFFNFIRILQLKEFSHRGSIVDKYSAPSVKGVKNYTAFFFLFHYGFFHYGYLTFLSTGMFATTQGTGLFLADSKYILFTVLIFFINHLFSYIYNKPHDTKRQELNSLMAYPYARIIPMHLTIIFGSFFINALPFFLILKTFADCVMHVKEHNMLRKSEVQQV